MIGRIVAIIFIFVCTSAAWLVLGGSIVMRTENSENASDHRVQSLWGGPQTQQPARAIWIEKVTEVIPGTPGSKLPGSFTREVEHELPLDQTRANVNLHVDYRQKGLLWFTTYTSDFNGRYAFRNDTDHRVEAKLMLALPSDRAVYENVSVTANDTPLDAKMESSVISATATLEPHATAIFGAAFRSHGMNDWAYSFGDKVAQLRDFDLRVTTDFKNIDFADETLPPTSKQLTADGWQLHWQYGSLVSGFHIDIKMPEHIQPGPLAGRISFFAPVSLFFFLVLILVITTMRGIPLHPMNYLFLSAAFFAFHLLLAYLVDHISIHLAMVACSLVSLALVISYLRLVVGPQFAFREAALGQLVYLVLFSYAFFWEGYTGLAITVVAIVTLFVVMQATAKIDWTAKFRQQRGLAPSSGMPSITG